jgi:hypothetical protein
MSRLSAVSQSGLFRTRQIEPHRLAWGVLLLSFAIFCLIAATVIVGIDYFLFQSTVPVRSTLSLGRGSVGITDLSNPIQQVGRNDTFLTGGMAISTDPQSQGTIRFTDPADDFRLIASVTLHQSSNLILRQASRPRFEWSRTRHIIDLQNVSGRVSVDVPKSAPGNLLINMETMAGAIINLEGSGHYIINATDEQVTVHNRGGNATFIPPDLRQGHSIPNDGLGIIQYSDNSVQQTQGLVNLLRDSKFESLTDAQGGEQPSWVCGNDPDDRPAGQFNRLSAEGVKLLQFLRGDGATTHGRTSCVQSFGQTGMDIRSLNYNYLSLRTTFFIASQSLSACGIDGSECPLMLRMDYIDEQGEAQRWYHGFYAREADPRLNYPLRCSTCLQDHDLINEKAWYTYDSPNLLKLFQAEPPPASIVSVWFYASGHEYDVRISEFSLLAGQVASPDRPVDEAAGGAADEE